MGKWSLERWIAVICLIFTLGVNWGRLVHQQDDIDDLKKFKEDVPHNYVPREVYELNQMHLAEAITELRGTLERLYAIEKETGEPARVQGNELKGKYGK